VQLTYIITINPILKPDYLNLLNHSFNNQTDKNFNVIFWNQTNLTKINILKKLEIKPNFKFSWYDLDRELFFGDYPIWDIYHFISSLLKTKEIRNYFISLHMEEFLDPDYNEKVIDILEKVDLDVLLGNLSNLNMSYDEVANIILKTNSPDSYEKSLKQSGIKNARFWTFPDNLFFNRPRVMINIVKKLIYFKKINRQPTDKGFDCLPKYIAEDVFFMSKKFALKSNWFLDGHHLYFEDIHICNRKGRDISKYLKGLTRFPCYFNKSKIYHVKHKKYYYQIEDEKFTNSFLDFPTNDVVLITLKIAIQMYKEGRMNKVEALNYLRRNKNRTGTQDLNFKLHLQEKCGL
jgi:hypothetical protein